MSSQEPIFHPIKMQRIHPRLINQEHVSSLHSVQTLTQQYVYYKILYMNKIRQKTRKDLSENKISYSLISAM